MDLPRIGVLAFLRHRRYVRPYSTFWISFIYSLSRVSETMVGALGGIFGMSTAIMILQEKRPKMSILSQVLALVILPFVASGATTASLRRIASEGVPKDDMNASIPVPFPPTFQIDFVTNITWSEQEWHRPSGVDGKPRSPPDHHLSRWISGRLYYDWTKKMQRIDHGPGSYECTHFYDYDGPCSLIFHPNWGMYRILLPKNRTGDGHHGSSSSSSPVYSCCLDIPNLGAPPPNWAKEGNPTYHGVVQDSVSNRSAREWIYDQVGLPTQRPQRSPPPRTYPSQRPLHGISGMETPVEQCHTMRQVNGGAHDGRPLLFSFPSAGGTQDYHYLVESMEEMYSMEAGIFALPDGCQTQFCKCDEEKISKSRYYR